MVDGFRLKWFWLWGVGGAIHSALPTPAALSPITVCPGPSVHDSGSDQRAADGCGGGLPADPEAHHRCLQAGLLWQDQTRRSAVTPPRCFLCLSAFYASLLFMPLCFLFTQSSTSLRPATIILPLFYLALSNSVFLSHLLPLNPSPFISSASLFCIINIHSFAVFAWDQCPWWCLKLPQRLSNTKSTRPWTWLSLRRFMCCCTPQVQYPTRSELFQLLMSDAVVSLITTSCPFIIQSMKELSV